MVDIKKIISTVVSFSLCMCLAAETFRVGKMHTVEISQDNNLEASAKIGINEAIAIFIPKERDFIEGLEIKMDIPDSVAEWMDSVACSVYDKVKPIPSSSQIDYSATREYVSTLPGRLSWVLQVPLISNNSLKANKYITKMDTVPDLSQNLIFLRLQPVMKGIPEETMKAKVGISVKPILQNKGMLDLTLEAENKLLPCSVFIDDKPVQFSGKNEKIMLDTGVHNISVISESYRNEVRTIHIDQAKTTPLSVEMKSIAPTLIILAPESTHVTLDGEKFSSFGTEFPISEGEHKIKFSIGEYEIVRTINVIKGRTYTANFEVDLQITEE